MEFVGRLVLNQGFLPNALGIFLQENASVNKN